MATIARLTRESDLPLCAPESVVLLERAAHAIWIYDLQKHRIRWANEPALHLWKAETLKELMARDFQPASQGTANRLDNLRHELAQGQTMSDKWTLYPLGEPLHIECRFTGVRFRDGNVGAMIEALEAERKVEATNTELRAIEALRQTPLMISLLTMTGHWLLHNPAAEALMFALDCHNIPNMDNFLTLFRDDREAAELRAKAIEDGSAEGVFRMVGRQFRMHHVQLRRIQDPVTGKLSLMITQKDVTHAYKLERRLEKALRHERAIAATQRQFLSMTSHEFRTPLSIIDAAARRIEKLLSIKEGPVVERLATIRTAVHRMNVAVDKTLSTASIAEGRFAFHPVSTDVRALLDNAISNQQSLHPDRTIECDVPELPALTIDPALVEQVFENLLSNAIKYSPAESSIQVNALIKANAVAISVADHGIGVPAEEIPMLFTRFFRSSNTRGVKGTGVGLHTVRYFMKLHGGKVTIKSKEGEGSTVTLTFPLNRD